MISPDKESMPLGLMFDQVVRSASADIPHYATLYSSNPHFENDRELWKTFIERFKNCRDDVERLRWLRFCLIALDLKDFEKFKAHAPDFNIFLEEIEKIDSLKSILVDFKKLPVQKKENLITVEWLSEYFEGKAHPFSFAFFVSPLSLIQLVIQKWNQNQKRQELVVLTQKLYKEGMLHDAKVKKEVRSFAFKVAEAGLGSDLLDLVRQQDEKDKIEFEDELPSLLQVASSPQRDSYITKMASDLVKQDQNLYSRLKPADFVHLAWTKNKGPSVQSFVDYFNLVTVFIKKSILDAKKKDQASLIELWIDVAKMVYHLNDLNLTIAIISTLEGSDIDHLSASRKIPEIKSIFKKGLFDLFDPVQHYHKLGVHIKKIEEQNQLYIPFMGQILSELTFINESPNEVEGHINKKKLEVITKILAKIFQKKVEVEHNIVFQTNLLQVLDNATTTSQRFSR